MAEPQKLLPSRLFTGEAKEVFSGDDLILLIDLGMDDLWKRKRVRLHGVDTPNAVNQGPETEAGKLRTYVRELVKNKRLHITPVSQNGNSMVAIIEIEREGERFNLNDDLIARGYKFTK
jgi:hypothetical protein